MSWIAGYRRYCGPPPDRKIFHNYLTGSFLNYEDKDTYILAGGLRETCFLHSDRDKNSGRIVVGIVIKIQGDSARFLTENNWENSLLPENGHYVFVTWDEQTFTIENDPLGLRTFYLFETKEGLYFSTRPDIIAAISGCGAIDLRAFGSHWLTFNQLSFRSLIKGIIRAEPGSRAEYRNGSLEMQSVHDVTCLLSSGLADIESSLSPLLNPALPGGKRLMLSLSGGLDSRTLLAMLVSREKDIEVLLLGDPAHPDLKISERIISRFGLGKTHMDITLPGMDDCIRSLQEYTAYTQAITPASAILMLGHYDRLDGMNRILTDGGFGEIARRQFFNRIALRNDMSVFRGYPESLFRYFAFSRGNLFSDEAGRENMLGVHEDLNGIREMAKQFPDIPIEDFLDLLAVRYRLPNFYGYEQGRLDGIILYYMPFAQFSFLQSVFRQSPAARKNGKLFKQIIRSRCPGLAKMPLVKGDITYPFSSNTLMTWVIRQIKSRLGVNYRDDSGIAFLNTMKPYILDIASSDEVRSSSLLNGPQIRNAIHLYYSGRTEYINDVNWFLSLYSWIKSSKLSIA